MLSESRLKSNMHWSTCWLTLVSLPKQYLCHNNKKRVGPTAYPSTTGQETCPNKQSLLELEATAKCLEIPEKAMVSGWHPTEEDLEELFPQYDGDILDSKGGFQSIHNWFGKNDVRLGWQIFFGGDGSGM